METAAKPIHSWWRRVRSAFQPGPLNPLLEEAIEGLTERFRLPGHEVQARPGRDTDLIITTAAFGRPLSWREALLFTARRRWRLRHTPTLFTLLAMTPAELGEILAHFEQALTKEPPDPADFDFPGLAARAFHTLVEQGRRGGPILSLIRLLQAQTKCIRLVLLVGEERPLGAYVFDLVGSHPWIDGRDPSSFYQDLVLRMVTSVSTFEVTQHRVVGDPIPHWQWKALATPEAMRRASRELGKRNFFTEMVRIKDLVRAPAVDDAIKSQYSEGCFATWDPYLAALVATITGSARPVEKEDITDDDLAVIVGVRPDGLGAEVREVEGKRNDPPSSEAVEMMEMDRTLPTVELGKEWDKLAGLRVPVTRSKLHGHRGVIAYDPRYVEHVHLDPPYYDYPVSCATEAQARAIKAAFGRAEALQNPADPRQVVFTVLPGHGVVIVEKWVPGKVPFQVIWEYMDAGYLEIVARVPQGRLSFVPAEDGRRRLRCLDPLAPLAPWFTPKTGWFTLAGEEG
ncbi:MAG: hypothetical protein GX493_06580 [Firmicutes bacterium]|nr:hypothetical protein [Bacillota bacterium]